MLQRVIDKVFHKFCRLCDSSKMLRPFAKNNGSHLQSLASFGTRLGVWDI